MSLFPLPQKYYIYDTETASGYYDDGGNWLDGGTSGWKEYDFDGTIQPLTAKEILSMEYGERDTGGVKIYTFDNIPFAQEGSTGAGSEVLVKFDERYYKLYEKSPYRSQLIEHNKYIAFLYKQTVVVN